MARAKQPLPDQPVQDSAESPLPAPRPLTRRNNPNAPPGPLYMPEYKLSLAEQADQLEAEAAAIFNEGKAAYEQSGAYVLNTVFLATVLLFITLAQRFQWVPVRIVILLIALGMLLVGLYRLFTFPIY